MTLCRSGRRKKNKNKTSTRKNPETVCRYCTKVRSDANMCKEVANLRRLQWFVSLSFQTESSRPSLPTQSQIDAPAERKSSFWKSRDVSTRDYQRRAQFSRSTDIAKEMNCSTVTTSIGKQPLDAHGNSQFACSKLIMRDTALANVVTYPSNLFSYRI